MTGRPASSRGQGERQHPADILGVGDMDDDIGLSGKQQIAGDPLLVRDGRERIDAGGIGDFPGLPAQAGVPAGHLHRVPG